MTARNRPSRITQEYLAAVLEYGHRHQHFIDGGCVHYEACPVCGVPVYMKRELGGEDRVNVELGAFPCTQCRDVQRRAPEIFKWVMNVCRFHQVFPQETYYETGD